MNIDSVNRFARSLEIAVADHASFKMKADMVRSPLYDPSASKKSESYKFSGISRVPRTLITLEHCSEDCTVFVEVFEFDSLSERLFYVRVLSLTQDELEDEDDTDEEEEDDGADDGLLSLDESLALLPSLLRYSNKATAFTDLDVAYKVAMTLAIKPMSPGMPAKGQPVTADRIVLNSINLAAGEVTQSLFWLSVHDDGEERIVALAAVGNKLIVHNEREFFTAINSNHTIAEFLSGTARSTWMKKATERLDSFLQAFGGCKVVQSGTIVKLDKTITQLMFEIQLDSGRTFWLMAETPA